MRHSTKGKISFYFFFLALAFLASSSSFCFLARNSSLRSMTSLGFTIVPLTR